MTVAKIETTAPVFDLKVGCCAAAAAVAPINPRTTAALLIASAYRKSLPAGRFPACAAPDCGLAAVTNCVQNKGRYRT